MNRKPPADDEHVSGGRSGRHPSARRHPSSAAEASIPPRRHILPAMTSIQPALWVDRASEAVAFYVDAFGATVLHRVGEGDEMVAQLGIGDAAFWVAAAEANTGRFSPKVAGGATGRTLLVVDNPDAMLEKAVDAGAVERSPVGDEHGWRVGRVVDPFGHEWEIGRPLGAWPPR